ncbi:hypothetical protein GUJ93_ZPchr0010g8996 [Zizania palustris]|uniref:Uncharacterized protein n=1 Tax=Zizania palustris TaxID=103762 RepID=A0A8J5WB53_ZIZPA|nr:hypothetical protein GUJ93_ZPchr0010g8996 [Zizania palustris]
MQSSSLPLKQPGFLDLGSGHSSAVYLEAGVWLPAAEQDAAEVRPAAGRKCHWQLAAGCCNLSVVLAVKQLEPLGIVYQDADCLGRRHTAMHPRGAMVVSKSRRLARGAVAVDQCHKLQGCLKNHNIHGMWLPLTPMRLKEDATRCLSSLHARARSISNQPRNANLSDL